MMLLRNGECLRLVLQAAGAHELGHYVVATSKGYRVSHDGLYIVYPGAAFTDADRLQVASAGFQTQWLMAELALRYHNGKEMKEPPGNFGAGVVCAHLGITLAYLTVLKDRKQGDVVGIAEATKRSNDRVALALVVPGALGRLAPVRAPGAGMGSATF